jgi:hypothetical protein
VSLFDKDTGYRSESFQWFYETLAEKRDEELMELIERYIPEAYHKAHKSLVDDLIRPLAEVMYDLEEES